MHCLRPVRGSLPPPCDHHAVKPKRAERKGRPAGRSFPFLLFFLERKKQRTFMPRDGARTAPLPSADLQFCVRGFLRCQKRQLGFSLKERNKDQRDAGPMPRDGARTAPSLRAVLRFCVRGFLRCRKRQLGFSLKERSKDQRDAGPMPRGRGAGRPLPGAKPLARTYSPLSIRRERQFTAPGRELSRPVPARSRKIFPMARKYTTMVTAGPRMSDRGSA